MMHELFATLEKIQHQLDEIEKRQKALARRYTTTTIYQLALSITLLFLVLTISAALHH